MAEQKHSLAVGENKPLVIDSQEDYSSEIIVVSAGQKYQVTCDGNQRWRDSFIKSKPTGFFNPLALLAGMRVKKVKCFCLCGAFDKNDATGFAIGTGETFVVDGDYKELSFFANDTKGYYENNCGSIVINVVRLQ